MAQNYSDLSSYFESKKKSYQLWLNEIGLGEILKVGKLDVYEDFVILQLNLNASSRDSSEAIWSQLREEYLTQHPIHLEDRLFLKLAHTFDVPYEDASIRVLSNNTNGKIPALDGRVRFDQETQKIVVEGFAFRSKVEGTLEVPKFRISEQFTVIEGNSNEKQNFEKKKYEVYDKIRSRASVYYKSKPGKVEFRPGIEDPLTFVVKNIKEEVVPAKTLNPYEMLYFTITFSEDENNVYLNCIIDGKYGSGLFFLTPTGVKNYLEMFPKYKKELEEYLEFTFKSLLYKWLFN